VRGLCIRNGSYYGQLWIDLGNGKKSARRFPLKDEQEQPIRSLAAVNRTFRPCRSDIPFSFDAGIEWMTRN
jgi:hypothetical protein